MTTKMRDSSYPFLDVREPDGNEYTIDFQDIFEQTPEQTRLTIGRSHDNEIVLPDPDKKVSRRHCTIEQQGDHWWLLDAGSANGTFLHQQGRGESEVDVRAVETILLQDGDVILILGKLTPPQEPAFWQLRFRDPNVTDRIERFHQVEMEYHLSQQKLFQVTQQQRTEIKLSPQERNLIHYLAQRNRNNNDQPTLCRHEELIKAILEEPLGHTNNEVTRLVWSLRQKIEPDSGEPRFLKIVQGLGYVLDIQVH